jgi:catechol 2,3-dioxygenase-like lactoylglutathione lyase family enzyme
MRIANAQLWVHDQDEALAFYTEKVGMEVRADVTLAEMGDFRWLTVGPPGQEDVSIVLMAIPGPPAFEQETIDQMKR